jgi:sulfatase modifying factor 1
VKVVSGVSVVIALGAGCGSATRLNASRNDAAIDSAGSTSEDATAGHEVAIGNSDTTDGEIAPGDAATVDANLDSTDAAHAWTPGPSCAGLAATCGPAGASDCCAASVIPGGTFDRGNDPAWPATVSDFRLDVYEITVGRFRAFVAAYPGNIPAPGSGRDPNNAADTGWDASWTPLLPADATALRRQIKCDPQPGFATWTDNPGVGESLPMNCMTWFVAQAFCIWDGGWLPTEAEWNYAAAGGSEQRRYPWSSPPASETIDSSHAVYFTSTTSAPVSRVGSRSPLGDGKWGQADLAGNVWELTRDQLDFQAPGLGYPIPCNDCISAVPVTTVSPGSNAAIHGGGFYNDPTNISTTARQNIPARSPEADIGARCARAP